MRPLHPVGPVDALPLFDEVGTVAGRAVSRTVHGGLSHGSAEAAREAVRAGITAETDKRTAAVPEEVTTARRY